MKKILFVVTDRKTGGVSMVLEDILNNLPLDKYKIDLFILNNEGNMIEGRIDKRINIIYGGIFFKATDIPISYFKKHFDLKLFYNKLRLIFLLKTGLINKRLIKERRKIIKEEYDIEVAFKDGFPALVTNAGATPKKIHWLHSTYKDNDPTRRYRKTFKNAYDDFYKIIAVSKETASGFNAHYNKEDKVITLKNIIDDKKIKRLGKVPEKLSDKKINFISVGRLANAKGYDRLLNVVYRLKQENLFNDCFLTIVGDGPDREKLFALKDELKLDCVNFTLSQENPYKFVAGADMYISSARVEPFGLVMGEALILGIPVLAVKTSATSDIFENEINGLVVDNSENGLYQGMKRIIEDKEIRKKLMNNAKKYDYSKINKEIIKSLENIFDS